jgi:site-specific DNA recombinase
MREYCAREGWTITGEYMDQGVSGMTSSRPAFDQMLTAMRSNKFNAILVTKLDRIGRSLKHIISLFEEFNKRGVQFIATTQNIDTTTAGGKLQMQLLAAFAEFERNIISERTRESLKGNKRVGKRGPDRKPRKRGPRKKHLFFINTPTN